MRIAQAQAQAQAHRARRKAQGAGASRKAQGARRRRIAQGATHFFANDVAHAARPPRRARTHRSSVRHRTERAAFVSNVSP
jgi:hypothetical protein